MLNALTGINAHIDFLSKVGNSLLRLPNPKVNLVDGFIGMIVSERGTEANVSSIKTKDRMLGEIIDLVG